jgi:hypothetical protein
VPDIVDGLGAIAAGKQAAVADVVGSIWAGLWMLMITQSPQTAWNIFS